MADEQITYDLDLLEASERAWKSNDGLRCVYDSLYADMKAACSGDRVLEIGSGIGASREVFSEITTTDIVKTPYVDRAMSAYEIEPESEDQMWSDIIALDVLHHLREPIRFFESAASALEPGGRVILMEPAATFFGKIFYKLFHHEPIVPAEITPPFNFDPNGVGHEFANMGMGVALFVDHLEAVNDLLADSGLSVDDVSFRDMLAYPLTGGYSRSQLLPTAGISGLMKLESKLPKSWMRGLGLRMLIVLEKREA